ncbi:gamma-tubulin complex component 2 [Wolfiporia cocos MD-104 SS10]|uniref:Spindle pole body component n=1 Tax=Wolfiporia cocos (strain MD-104) TaxID=742152 RepID=A0A2H3JKE3_WOLCO|nr:gamma-tubulin complex component 2 [Wolfiporia cocos MD-104 SS10]
MDPYNPGTRTGVRKKLGLSTREYTKVAGTIASVRRNRQHSDGTPEDDVDEYGAPRGPSAGVEEPSFIAETSFVRAPLNCRVAHGATYLRNKGKKKGKGEASASLEGVPIEIQEALVLEDLLFVLMGIEGTYITYHPDYSPDDDDPMQGMQFAASPTLDPSLHDLVERILPLATYYTAITSFIELRSHLDFGLVNHALCAAMRDMLKEYQTLLSQLEHAFNTSPQFTLQKLWFYVHPTLHTLSLLYLLTTELANADDPSAALSISGSSSSSDSEEEARNEALGLGGAKLKAVLSEINKGVDSVSSGIPVKGGEVLAILYERMQNMSGDPAARTLYSSLLRAAGKPYVEMIQVWIHTGRLVDPYEELCVKESKFIDRGTLEIDYTDEYWERRYTLRDGSTPGGSSKRHQAGVPLPRTVGGRLPGGACIPPILERWKHKMLLAGKYLNVIRECGIEISRDPSRSDGEISLNNELLYKSIDEAYAHANRNLLQLLLRDQQLIPRLRSLKRFFFLSQSSFLTHLLDLSSMELRKSAKSASLVKLQSLLDLALNTDTQGEDAMFREDLRITMATSGLYEWLLKVVSVSGALSGEEGDALQGHANEETKKEREKEKDDKKQMLAIDALTLDYNVKFPLSLVISRKTILRYQLIFRFLLHLKYVEQLLSSMWIEHKSSPWRHPARPSGTRPQVDSQVRHDEAEEWRKRVFLLRARMLAFVQQILAFATFEVLEPNWRKLEGKLEAGKVETVDQLLRDHVDFLDTCLKECMLTSSRLLKAFSRLIVTCSTFALYSTSFTKSAFQALAAAESGEDNQAMMKRWEFLARFETNFDHWFKVHLDCVQFYASSENVSLLPLVVRLSSIKAVP